MPIDFQTDANPNHRVELGRANALWVNPTGWGTRVRGVISRALSSTTSAFGSAATVDASSSTANEVPILDGDGDVAVETLKPATAAARGAVRRTLAESLESQIGGFPLTMSAMDALALILRGSGISIQHVQPPVELTRRDIAIDRFTSTFRWDVPTAPGFILGGISGQTYHGRQAHNSNAFFNLAPYPRTSGMPFFENGSREFNAFRRYELILDSPVIASAEVLTSLNLKFAVTIPGAGYYSASRSGPLFLAFKSRTPAGLQWTTLLGGVVSTVRPDGTDVDYFFIQV